MAGPSFRDRLGLVLDAYRARVADDSDDLDLLVARHAAGDALEDRRTLPGHLTTSAIVLDPTGREVLLVFHTALGRWLQPGGHWECAPSFAASALREAMEETGVTELPLHPWHAGHDLPVDIDTHPIPANARKGEPAHVHFDLRYVFVAPRTSALVPQADEVWRRLGGG
jgi:8-oxo-dGTP pyrophosphatase MutT (NUDIX family)